MKVRINATEMTDGEAEFISLVPTGAIRQPFKVMKSEDGHQGGEAMNFTKLFHDMDRRQKMEIEPELLAIAVSPGADLEKVKALLAKADLATDEIQEIFEGEGDERALAATVFVQEGSTALDLAADNQAVVQLSDEIGAVCLVRNKQFQPFSDTENFGEAMAAQSFFPGFRVGMDVLEDKLFEIAMKADSGSDMAQELSKAFTAFGQAVVSMAQELPQSVFKLEEIVRKGSDDPVTGMGATGDSGGGPPVDLLSDERPPSSSLPEKDKAKTKTEGTEDEDEKSKKDAKKDNEAEASGEETAEGEGEGEVQKDETLTKLLAAVQGIGEKVDEGLAGVRKEVTELGERVTQAESVAKSADEATRGRVRTSGDDEEGTGQVRQKTDAAQAPALMDTAFNRPAVE